MTPIFISTTGFIELKPTQYAMAQVRMKRLADIRAQKKRNASTMTLLGLCQWQVIKSTQNAVCEVSGVLRQPGYHPDVVGHSRSTRQRAGSEMAIETVGNRSPEMRPRWFCALRKRTLSI